MGTEFAEDSEKRPVEYRAVTGGADESDVCPVRRIRCVFDHLEMAVADRTLLQKPPETGEQLAPRESIEALPEGKPLL